jgi:hypothetical protein
MMWANGDLHNRAIALITGQRGRRNCHCGCGKRSTHRGTANGICVMIGCEWAVRIWVRDGTAAVLRRILAERRATRQATPSDTPAPSDHLASPGASDQP